MTLGADRLLDSLMTRVGIDPASADRGRNHLAQSLRRDGVRDSADLDRILALPRRAETPDDFVTAMSIALRLREYDDEGDLNELRPKQAEFLRELWTTRGAFAPMRVGSGKTLCTLLAPVVMGAQRPVLVLPAQRREETRAEFAIYRRNWRVTLPTLVSYEKIRHPDSAYVIQDLDPDLLLLDEADKAKSWDASTTRRLGRAIAERPHMPVATLSGTLITGHLLEYWHLLIWALKARAPAPLVRAEAERWAAALDSDVPSHQRMGTGALDRIPGGFAEWMRGSAGVVCTPGSDCDAEIHMSAWAPELPADLAKIIDQTEQSGMRPDGVLLDEWALPECLCQLALGFFYTWDPLPPKWWMVPRAAWHAYARAVLDEHIPAFDSESLITSALDRWAATGRTEGLPPAAAEGLELRRAWLAVKDRFEPNSVPVWYTDAVLRDIVATSEPGTLIWTKYRAVGEALERMGIPYYPGGTRPTEADGRTIALSIKAHGVGKNLQAWHHNLVTTPPAKDVIWEQLIGRTHRARQEAPIVTVRVAQAIPYHERVLERAIEAARRTQKDSGFSQKLVDARWLT